jgi:hypothetical protein
MNASNSYKAYVFISFSLKDSEWVNQQLLPMLESNGVAVCIDYRDFQPGVPSIVGMELAIKESWKTILVLTPNYIASAWSEFESILIGTIDPSGRHNRILPILLEKCDLPLRINYLTYLDFTDSSLLDLQWQKLIKSFDKPINNFRFLHAKPDFTQITESAKPKGIPSNIIIELRQILIECEEISTNARLRSLFNYPSLLPYKAGLPEATSLSERVDLLIDYLLNKKLRTGESVLIIFLQVISERISNEDNNKERIAHIIDSIIISGYSNKVSMSSSVHKIDLHESSDAENKRNLQVIEKYRKNLYLIDEQIASFVDPRSVPLDIKLTRTEIVKKILELENEVLGFRGLLNESDAKNIQPTDFSNREIMSKLDSLVQVINEGMVNLEKGQSIIINSIKPVEAEIIQDLLMEVRKGRVAISEMQEAVKAARGAINFIVENGVEINDPNISKVLSDINQSLNKGVPFEQQLELTLPVIPLLINYRLSLGTAFDLSAVWDDFVNRVKKRKINK